MPERVDARPLNKLGPSFGCLTFELRARMACARLASGRQTSPSRANLARDAPAQLTQTSIAWPHELGAAFLAPQVGGRLGCQAVPQCHSLLSTRDSSYELLVTERSAARKAGRPALAALT